MNNEQKICSKSETIGIKEVRNLMEMVNTMKTALTFDEYTNIAIVFGMACDRILKENGLE